MYYYVLLLYYTVVYLMCIYEIKFITIITINSVASWFNSSHDSKVICHKNYYHKIIEWGPFKIVIKQLNL